jgi:hypothetical protein
MVGKRTIHELSLMVWSVTILACGCARSELEASSRDVVKDHYRGGALERYRAECEFNERCVPHHLDSYADGTLQSCVDDLACYYASLALDYDECASILPVPSNVPWGRRAAVTSLALRATATALVARRQSGRRTTNSSAWPVTTRAGARIERSSVVIRAVSHVRTKVSPASAAVAWGSGAWAACAKQSAARSTPANLASIPAARSATRSSSFACRSGAKVIRVPLLGTCGETPATSTRALGVSTVAA